MKFVIEVNNLVKRYRKGKENAVDDISFAVRPGEFFTLLGPNGAGKTTTISILTTILSKTAGTVRVAGFDIDKQASQVRKQVGIIFQKPSLDENLTAEENIRLHTMLYGLYPFKPSYGLMPEGYKKKVRELAKVLGIEKELNKPIKTFSGGMKRKLEIIRSLSHHPKILFLDEPTTGLDPQSRQNLWEYLNDVRKKYKTTIFLTTHYLEESENADRVCIINQGKIVALGTPAQIKSELVEEFVLMQADRPEALKKELNKHRLKFAKYSVNNGDWAYRINTSPKLTAQKIIQKIKVPLKVLRIHNPSLEKAYLEIVRNAIHL